MNEEKGKVLLVIFSGTGNTRAVGEMISRRFREKGYAVETVEIKRPFPEIKNIDSYRFAGFGYPVHAFNIPRIFRKFLETLPAAAGAKAFIFKTSGEPLGLNDASSFVLRKTLKKKGYDVVSDAHFLMPYNVIFRYPDGAVKTMVKYADFLSRSFVDKLICGVPDTVKYKKRYRLFSALLRIQYLGAALNGKLIKADARKCVRCLKCVKNCPTKNIKLKSGKIKFASKCTMCMRCAMMCPEDAIKFGFLNKWKVHGRYDFERILADDSIDDNFFSTTDSRFFRMHRKYYEKLNK